MMKRKSRRRGFTLIELSVSILVGLVVIISMGMVLSDNGRAWNELYHRVHTSETTDGYMARLTFDRIIRKAAGDRIDLIQSGDSVEVDYYNDAASTKLDRYGLLYLDGTDLKLEEGDLATHTALSTQTVCSNVTYCSFTSKGDVVEMVLKLDDGSSSTVVACSALGHN